MCSFNKEEWELFLRKMISHNLGLFEKSAGTTEAAREERLNQLKCWNSAKNRLNSMLTLENNMKQVEEHGRGKMTFDEEMKALGDEEIVDEFESYFSNLVGDVEANVSKYSAAMQQLTELLELERETEEIKRKVADFKLDYDEDLACEEVSLDKLFSASPSNLLLQLQNIQDRKVETMRRVGALYGKHLETLEPISVGELQPFLEAVLNK